MSHYHLIYILGSFVSAFVAAGGVAVEEPILYAYMPGLIGATCALIASLRFLKDKQDLAGLIATFCGFGFYQAFQANPVTLPDFTADLDKLAPVDTIPAVFLGNLTTGLMLLAHRLLAGRLRNSFKRMAALQVFAERSVIDRRMRTGYVVIFMAVALPNVLFGQVVVGAWKAIVNQRAAWASPEDFSGFQVWGGPIGQSLVNAALWAPSLFFLWAYLLGSRYRRLAWITAPLVLLWTAGVALQGSRTYLVVMGIGIVVYFLGSGRVRTRSMVYAVLGSVTMLLLLQMATLFRMEGLKSFDADELSSRLFEIRGNEGTSSQFDGLEYFRTELVENDNVVNPFVGLAKGLVLRPIEGILMPLPRTLFPWKPSDENQDVFSIWVQNVRLGFPSTEAFFGASPGLIGRELIRYGYLGPLTLYFWLGLLMAIAEGYYQIGVKSDLHRLVAAVLVAFLGAQMRDWVAMWFLPFLPAFTVLFFVLRGISRTAATKAPAQPPLTAVSARGS